MKNALTSCRGPALAHALVLAALFLSGCGFRNLETPAGYVGYITKGSVFGKSEFVGLQTGPTSTGATFLVDVRNVSITPYTYDELFAGDSAIIAKDQLKMTGGVHFIFRIRPDRVRDFVEHYTTLRDGQTADQVVQIAYANFVKEPLRTSARNQLEKYEGLSISEHINEAGAAITADMVALLKDTPFEIISVRMGNIQPPVSVSEAVALKIASKQDLIRRDTEILIAAKDAERRKTEAKGIADSMNEINGKLTPIYLQYEAIKAQATQVASPNHTVIYIPVGPMGVPLVGSLDLAKPAQPETKQP